MRAKYSRQDYMDGNVTHRQYYGQFVTPVVLATVEMCIGKDRILASVDKHLNDIPLSMWDRLHGSIVSHAALKEAGDGLSLSGTVCVAKEAARQIKEEAA